MTSFAFLEAMYLLTVILALIMTHSERRRTERQQRGHDLVPYVLLGYILCLVWPLTMAFMVVSQKMVRAQA